LLGFEDLERFALVSPPEDHPFRWLVSIEDPDVHFAVAPPACFLDGPYLITLTEGDAESIELAQEDRLSVYIIASAGHDGRVTGNLKGPVVVNVRNGFARQLLVYSARYLLHQHLVAPAGGQTGRTAQTTVRLAGRRVA
jgi:flagellar assembly factor FliW